MLKTGTSWITFRATVGVACLVASGFLAGQDQEDKPYILPPIDEIGIPLPSEEGEVELPRLPDGGESEISSSLFPKPGESSNSMFDFNSPGNAGDGLFAPQIDPWTELFPDPEALNFNLPEPMSEAAFSNIDYVRKPQLKIRIDKVGFVGNTKFSDSKLTELVSFLTTQSVSTEDIEAARNALTVHYVEAGFLNSGAKLPDQELKQGELVFNIVEGKLTRISIKEPEKAERKNRLRPGYLKQRLASVKSSSPLDSNQLQEKLRLLQANPNIKKLNAELKPDINPGEAYIELVVEENPALHAGVDIHNQRPPSVGAGQIEPWIYHTNLTGFSDTLSVRYGLLDQGFDQSNLGESKNLSASYSIPVTRWDTEFFSSYQHNDYVVIEEPFDEIDLSGESQMIRFGLRQPFAETLEQSFAVTASLDFRESQTFLFDEPFSLTPGAVDGLIDLTVLRIGQEWTNRSRNHVLALRSTFGFGLNEPYENAELDRDSSFTSWIGQGQYIRRLGGEDSDLQLVLRGTLQLSDDPLLAPEQTSIGGVASVRGYRENQLVRDMGFIGGAEVRIPILYREKDESPMLVVAPFFDYGSGWNRGAEDEDFRIEIEEISSTGLGLIFSPNDKVNAQLYWGHPFTKFDSRDRNLQDSGFHFKVSVSAF